MRAQNKTYKIRKSGLKNIRKQRQKYPSIAKKILEVSDIIIEVLDARFVERTRNLELEQDIKKSKKRIIYVLNKSDLVKPKEIKLKLPEDVHPYIFVSSTQRKGSRELRNKIKMESKKVVKRENRFIKGDKIIESNEGKIIVGIIGYPNTGKSTLINLLVGKHVAGTGAQAGFTKGLQKLKLDSEVVLIDSPGVIPDKDYSSANKDQIAAHTIVGGRSYSQVKYPEFVVAKIMREFPDILEKYFKIKVKGDPEELIEILGRKWNFLKKGDEVNFDTTSRKIIKEWQEGAIKV